MHSRKVSVVGLGYVGLPVAIAFGKIGKTIGFDISPKRIEELQNGFDRTLEVEAEELRDAQVVFTNNVSDLSLADFHIIAVPTPIDQARQPDIKTLLRASKLVGSRLKHGDIVVYESTVYPGATEEDCVPLLEAESGLRCGKDFFVGYSPERINPGDKEHTFSTITKVVSGQTPEICDIVAEVYGSVVSAGVHRAPSIKAAEAAKVIENTQRDLNIALMNELSVIFERMGIDTLDVLEAAETKWNFLPFRPGLVGGHCIGVDPYYLTHKAEKLGYHPDVILAGRRINDGMGEFIGTQCVKHMIKSGKPVKGAKLAVMGLTFKENCPDLRNSKVIDVINSLKSFGVDVLVHDPMADKEHAKAVYQVDLIETEALTDLDAVIFAVAHKEYRNLSLETLQQWLKPEGALFDIKGIFDRALFTSENMTYWRL